MLRLAKVIYSGREEKTEMKKKLSRRKKGKLWWALRKAWRGFKIAKSKKDKKAMKKYAKIINELQAKLGFKVTPIRVD